ncbi:MAG: SRPBCC family protein [Acaryochloridaceae cyanobacterium RL_2_7]|nr:SRPBCC family protein [Acaryochloridaceae cyanobacterium RL_2_7]
MSKLLKILGVFAGVVTLLMGFGFLLPGQAHVERDILIAANPEQIFPYIGDFHAWNNWSPWAKMDSNAEFSLTGEGLGQRMEWKSDNPDVGDGAQEVIAFEAPKMMKTHLEFEGQGMADATFDLQPQNDGTLVTWSLDSNLSEKTPFLLKPISNYFAVMMDSMVGPQYEIGLSSLKKLVEEA